MLERSWQLIDKEKPWTANAERSFHYHKRAGLVRDCRERFHWLAVSAQIPPLQTIRVEAIPLSKSKRTRQDVAAVFPAVKAAIDGIVDAGVLPDDSAKHLVSLTFYPLRLWQHDGLLLRIISEEENEHQTASRPGRGRGTHTKAV